VKKVAFTEVKSALKVAFGFGFSFSFSFGCFVCAPANELHPASQRQGCRSRPIRVGRPRAASFKLLAKNSLSLSLCSGKLNPARLDASELGQT